MSFFILGVSGCPHTFVCPHMFVCLLGLDTPHMSIIFLYASVCSERHLHVVGVVGGPYMFETSLTCWTPPPYGGCLPICLTPPLIGWLPCASVCLGGYLHIYGEYSPYVWGHLHICEALVPGSTSIGCPLCFILYLFCSSLFHTYLPWLQLLLLQLRWCLLVCHLFHQ